MCAHMTRPILIALLLLTGMPALAQTTLSPSQTMPQATVAATVPSEQDLQALNFYLEQKDQASANAELRRLRLQYPAWVPPEDLGKLAITQPTTEIDTIYRQIAAGQLTEARATIAAAQTEYPNWTAPDEMILLLETAEGQLKLDAALDAGNAAEALQIASDTAGLLRCDRVNNAWRIAKAQEAQQAGKAALATYTGILNACTNFPDIMSTLEKSDSVTSDAELSDLITIAQTRFPEKAIELSALQAKLLAGRGNAPADIAIQTGVTSGTLAGAAGDVPNIRPESTARA